MRQTLACIRLFSFTSILLLYFILTIPLLIPYIFFPNSIRNILNHLVGFCSRLMLIIANIKIEFDGDINLTGKLFVCNHLGYLDILVLASLYPSSFVTSMEMKKTPFLGQICILAGCVFVNRRNKRNIHNEIAEIAETLKSGINVTVFPEATSTNGSEVIKFRRPLFQAAYDANTECVPLAINYESLNGEKLNLSNRDTIFWYGEMTFGGHIWELFQQKQINVSVTMDEIIHHSEYEDTKMLAQHSHERVKYHYRPVIA